NFRCADSSIINKINVTVTNNSNTVSGIASTTNMRIGDPIYLTDNTTTLISNIISVNPNVSVTLNDNWIGSTGSTATLYDPGQGRITIKGDTLTSSITFNLNATAMSVNGARITVDGVTISNNDTAKTASTGIIVTKETII